ncbi:GNAT family N-acetyltransferase [Arthrobacter monumenti]
MSSLELPPYPDTPGLSWRGLGPDDLEAWFLLLSRIMIHDDEQERTTMADLQTLTRQSWVNLVADHLVGVDSDGQFRAVGRNAFRPGATDEHAVTLGGGVDPGWRGRGIGRELLRWQCTRAAQNIAALRADADAPGRIRCIAEEQVTSRHRLYKAAGFEPVRWFTELRKPLDAAAPFAEPGPLPGGLQVMPFSDDVSDEVRLAHNEAFADHWGSDPHDRESWQTNLLEDEAFRPAASFAIVDPTTPERRVVAYVINAEYVQDWPHQGFTEGYTDLLGVRRQWRGLGLAKYLLALTAREFAALARSYVTLGVDTDNPSGALSLYHSLGYKPVHSTTFYQLDA